MRQKKLSKVFFFLFICMLFFYDLYAANFPFPQNASYKHGILPTVINSNAVQNNYDKWLNTYYEENGELARIKFDRADQTVSEGIAYGMLIMVFMDNAINDTQNKFDKLWNYYNSFLDNNGLMHWKINGFSSVAERNAATDADLDAALALILGYKQWGQSRYINAAKELISKIRVHEVNANHYLKPGDGWDDKKNPSYFSVAALRLFAQIDSEYTNFWNEVIDNSYNLINASKNVTTGLVPDWCNESGDPLGTDFSYEAIRVPWRMAWAYVWFGDAEAYTISNDISNWVKNAVSGNPAEIRDGYNLDGGVIGQWNNPAFVGGFSMSSLVDSQHQTWLDASYYHLQSFSGDETYYNKTLQVLYLLLASGNFPNYWLEGSSQSAITPILFQLILNDD